MFRLINWCQNLPAKRLSKSYVRLFCSWQCILYSVLNNYRDVLTKSLNKNINTHINCIFFKHFFPLNPKIFSKQFPVLTIHNQTDILKGLSNICFKRESKTEVIHTWDMTTSLTAHKPTITRHFVYEQAISCDHHANYPSKWKMKDKVSSLLQWDGKGINCFTG